MKEANVRSKENVLIVVVLDIWRETVESLEEMEGDVEDLIQDQEKGADLNQEEGTDLAQTIEVGAEDLTLVQKAVGEEPDQIAETGIEDAMTEDAIRIEEVEVKGEQVLEIDGIEIDLKKKTGKDLEAIILKVKVELKDL
jgi:hypothetical protein